MATLYQEYASSSNLTVTGLASLASSSTWTAGWTSGTIDNTTLKYTDYRITAKITVNNSVAPTTGTEIRVYAYDMLDDSNWPDLFSSGTEGTEGAATVHDSEQLASGLKLLWSSAVDTGTGEVHSMPGTSIFGAFGFCPAKFAIFIAHNTGQNLHSSGQQVTYKGHYHTIS